METKKTLLTVIFGLILTLAGSRAFAGDAYQQLIEAGKTGSVERDVIVVEGAPANVLTGAPAATAAVLAGDAKKAPAAAPAVAVKVPAPQPAPPPPGPNPILKFISGYTQHIVMAGVGAYLGYALVGTLLGALTGGLFLLGMVVLANL